MYQRSNVQKPRISSAATSTVTAFQRTVFGTSLNFFLTVSVFSVFQTGMPQTVCSGTMFTTPSGFSPHLACAEPGEEEEEAPQEGPGPGACLADGPPITSASLDTLIQNLVPTADYYPEVNDPPPFFPSSQTLQKPCCMNILLGASLLFELQVVSV